MVLTKEQISDYAKQLADKSHKKQFGKMTKKEISLEMGRRRILGIKNKKV